MLDLNTIWFILIGVIFTVFFCLEGFDYGVGIISFFFRGDKEKHSNIVNTIAPFWDGNEVWMVTAGGAIFAAFPVFYAVLFSGLYIPLVLLIVALIARVFSFELWHQNQKEDHAIWYIWGIFLGSIVPAFLWGIVMYTLITGSSITYDGEFIFSASWISILSIQSVLAGITAVITFTLYGVLYLNLKVDWHLKKELKPLKKKLIPIWFLTAMIFIISAAFDLVIVPTPLKVISILVWISIVVFNIVTLKKAGDKMSFISMVLAICSSMFALFVNLFPNLMISNINPEFSLNIINAASSQYTLNVMTYAAFIFVPMILLYQFSIYWIFRKNKIDET